MAAILESASSAGGPEAALRYSRDPPDAHLPPNGDMAASQWVSPLTPNRALEFALYSTARVEEENAPNIMPIWMSAT
jgi:hypothetical protein